MWHSYLTWYMSLSNNTKLFESVWELWPVQDFCFRGDKYIMKKLRVVSLAHNMPSCPLFIPTTYYQNTSKGIKVIKHTSMHLRTLPNNKIKSKKGHNTAKILQMVTNIEHDLYFTMIYLFQTSDKLYASLQNLLNRNHHLNLTIKTKSKRGHNSAKIRGMITNIEPDQSFKMM